MSKIYIKKNRNSETKFTYFSNPELPKNIKISTPLTFAFAGENLILAKKKNGWWDILGGKIEKKENWEEALKREAFEEAGIEIDFIQIIGYVLAENFGDEKETGFFGKTILPITMSFVQKKYEKWKPLETLEREMFNRKEALELFKKRDDNNQLYEIAKDVFDFFKKQNFSYNFEYFSANQKKIEPEIPITQAMTFVYNDEKKFFLVKDFGEEFYSLPGGGCRLNENGRRCAKREIFEEAQFKVKNLNLLGTILVSVKKNEKILSRTQQLRFIAEAEKVFEFKKDEREEIEERILANFNFMKNNVKLLKNKTAEKILEDLKDKLWK